MPWGDAVLTWGGGRLLEAGAHLPLQLSRGSHPMECVHVRGGGR